ncbi:oxysterol-binding protein-related protein 11-like [Lineus longissimus]|uniref:oxysterol-binding protein-related protein 11-like n=1 Tax=Lineus longissimus TaxID=88925 RepID=UPI00315DD22F
MDKQLREQLKLDLLGSKIRSSLKIKGKSWPSVGKSRQSAAGGVRNSGSNGGSAEVSDSESGGTASAANSTDQLHVDEVARMCTDMSEEEFEQQEEKLNLRQHLEGQLYKYTNVMKGWQTRWFVLDPTSGMLEYFEKEEHKRNRARGSVHLAGAVISPSDEDSQTFTVHAANGEVFRLKAADARERQHWVNRLRATAEFHTDTISLNLPPVQKLDSKPNSQFHENHTTRVARPPEFLPPTTVTRSVAGDEPDERSHHKSVVPTSQDSFKNVKDILSQVHEQSHQLIQRLDDLPSQGQFLNSLDKEILLLKATSQATMSCLEECLSILQQQQAVATQGPLGLPSGATIEWIKPKTPNRPSSPLHHIRKTSHTSSMSSLGSSVASVDLKPELVKVNHEEEVEDTSEYTDTDLGGVEEHKSVILHLLSQLKLGMDLTKVVLPTFILEKRSLLEMFADCMAHPDTFLKIPDRPDAESRMLAVVEWYLTSFHAGRKDGTCKGSVAKKPYNPIIGEHFHCSWDVSKEALSEASRPVNGDVRTSDDIRLSYCAEQVSHHPPISAFYFECPEKEICMNASIWTKSKFMGMSIGVVMVGKVTLSLLGHNEDYVFTLPSAYARSILTVPWVELGDKITINCPKTGYSSSVTFHTKSILKDSSRVQAIDDPQSSKVAILAGSKPFYGGKLHRVTTEVRNNATQNICCRVTGEWNGAMEFSFSNGDTKLVDTGTLPTTMKRVRPIEKQENMESRRLWQHVTNALRVGDINTATEHKRFLEERQREGERYRRETESAFPTKYFHLEGDSWTYNHVLRNGQTKGTV